MKRTKRNFWFLFLTFITAGDESQAKLNQIERRTVSGDPPQKKRSQHITVTAFIDYCFVVTPPYRYRLPIANAIKGGIVSGDSPPP